MKKILSLIFMAVVCHHFSNAQCSVSAISVDVTCFGNCDGFAIANATGTAPFTYSWNTNPVQTTQTVTNLCAGTYIVTCTDAANCVSYDTVTINSPTQLTVSVTTTPTCNGCNTGAATASASGGTPAYTYQWSGSIISTNNSLTNLTCGVYTVTVTDMNGCTASAVGLVNCCDVTTTATSNCYNGLNCTNGNGTATATPSMGTAPYTYSWNTNPIQTTQTATGLCAGKYVVTVTDSINCVSTDTIRVYPVILNTITTTPASCATCCDGSAKTFPSGGITPYSFDWSPGNPAGDGTDSLFLACVGTYTVCITDSLGCYTCDTAQIRGCSVTTSATSNCNNPLNCTNGTGTATTIATGIPPYNYSWNTNPIQTTQTATGLCAGKYVVTVTDSINCISTDTVRVNPQIVLSMTTTPATTSSICDGTATVNVVSGGSPPFTYTWYPTIPSGTNTAYLLCSGVTYTVCVQDIIGCISCDSAYINFSTGIQNNSNSSIQIFPNPSNGTFVIKSAKVFIKEITISNVIGEIILRRQNVNEKEIQINKLAKGVYMLYVMDESGNLSSQKIVVN